MPFRLTAHSMFPQASLPSSTDFYEVSLALFYLQRLELPLPWQEGSNLELLPFYSLNSKIIRNLGYDRTHHVAIMVAAAAALVKNYCSVFEHQLK